jgi:hypothetical protein
LKSPSFGYDDKEHLFSLLTKLPLIVTQKFSTSVNYLLDVSGVQSLLVLFFVSCCFQVLTRGTKPILKIYDKFEITNRGSNKFQTFVEKTWMPPMYHPPKEQ